MIQFKNYTDIINLIKLKIEDKKINKFPKIIAVSKTFRLEKSSSFNRLWTFRLW
jgi:hypothetical protein